MSNLRVSFIGLGAMGAPMAANLIKAGFSLTVYNRTREKEIPLAEMGAGRASSPAEAAEAGDIIITIVSDVPDILSVISGDGGVLSANKLEGKLIIDMSTIGPNPAKRISELCRQKGASFMDAPVSGGVWGAQNATLSIMVGGSSDDLQRAMPVFEALGKTIIHFGDVGSGQAAKLVNQVIGAGALAAVAEGLTLAESLGLDASLTVDAVSKGAAASWALENLGPRMISGEYDSGFKISLFEKDLRLVSEAIGEGESPLPVSTLVRQLFNAAKSLGHGDHGTQSVIEAYRKLKK